MQLATFYRSGSSGDTFVGIIDDAAAPRAIELAEVRDVGELLATGRELTEAGLESLRTDRRHALDELEFAPLVVRPSKVVCVGVNYLPHIREMGREKLDYPTLFCKFPDSLIGAGAPIVIPRESDAMDFEGEIAMVIGREVRRASAEEARAVIAGFTCANDGSVRDWQYRTAQWLQGKVWEGSTPLGPVLTTADAMPEDPHITTRVSGEVMQQGRLSDLVFDPVTLISYISTIVTLRPGDVILTGTPGGVGHARDPQRYLRAGDIVEVTVDGVGTLRNPVVKES